MSSRRQDIIEAVRDRLTAISQANGYQTDAGAVVLVGEAPSFGPADPPQAIALTVDDDSATYQGEQVVVVLPLVVHAIVKADLAAPYLAAEAIVADIKKAIEVDHDLGGLTVRRGLERGVVKAAVREPGSEYVAARVEYRATYAELWGAP